MNKNIKQNKAQKATEEPASRDHPAQGHQHSQTSERKPVFPIVGIGASAGGLEAFTAFLHSLSPDLGMAYIFVPHLDPAHESAFSQILARATSMPVHTVADDMQVKQNNVYVIPPSPLIAVRPRVPSEAVPERTTPMALLSWSAARERKKISIALFG
ncbi:MAG: hypothetical protein JOZ33_11805, partial [Acidobacteriaceae bacterium]|nr:hypothetical protein [Acidobacteriaceae bacterium]